MYFANEQRGWIAETFSMWHTEDGGKSWAKGLSSSLSASAGKGLLDIFFVTPQIGWACGSGEKLYHTNDGGVTWQSQEVAKGADYFYQVIFPNPRVGWLKGGSSMYRTVDGGQTWQSRSIAGADLVIGLTSFISADEGWVVGHVRQEGDPTQSSKRGVVLHTVNGGLHWQAVQVGEHEPFFSRVRFMDESRGWLFSRDNTYRTEDGGKTWRVVLQLRPLS